MKALSDSIDEHRDHWWRREATRQIESIYAAERFIEEVHSRKSRVCPVLRRDSPRRHKRVLEVEV
jgi:hypothetical protein